MMKTVIVDDESAARMALSRRLAAHSDRIQILGEADNARIALDCIARIKPDLVFLDIRMPGLSGIGLARMLHGAGDPMVVFLTAYSDQALDAFEVGAIDYLTKPINPDRLQAAIDRAWARHAQSQEAALGRTLRQVVTGFDQDERQAPAPATGFLRLTLGDRTVTLDPRAIDYLEAAGDYTCVVSGSDNHVVRRPLKALEQDLPTDRFVRCHRTYVVNMDRLIQLTSQSKGGHVLRLIDGKLLPVSRRRLEAVRLFLDRNAS